ncbi:hypothetical protein D3C80_448500 [compost metagenome]
MIKAHHEKYKDHTIMRGMYGNGSYNVYNILGHLVGNVESRTKARKLIDQKQKPA